MTERLNEDAGLKVAVQGRLRTLELDRVARSNSLTPELIKALQAELRAAHDDPDCQLVVLTAAGERSFSGGADLKDARMLQFDSRTTRAPYAELMRTLYDIDVPVIARVNGSAAAGGVGIVAMCDFAIAADDIRMSISEIDIGFFPSMVTVALRRCLSRRQMLDLCMRGTRITAAQALEYDILSDVVPRDRLDSAVDALVEDLLQRPGSALRRGKYMLRAIDSAGFYEALALTETTLRLQSGEPSAVEGLAAFREKRPARWPT